jgi:mono/diheme cytochrome c family protein
MLTRQRSAIAATPRLGWGGSGIAALVAAGVLACLSTASTGCDKPSPSAARVWTPTDHRSQDDDRAQSAQQGPGPGATGAAGAAAQKDDAAQLVELAWRQQCVNCHGAAGHGDGPMGAMLRAPDLTRDEWQAKISDADIAAIIQTGRNKMPKFDLPDVVVRGLVARIRSLRGS